MTITVKIALLSLIYAQFASPADYIDTPHNRWGWGWSSNRDTVRPEENPLLGNKRMLQRINVNLRSNGGRPTVMVPHHHPLDPLTEAEIESTSRIIKDFRRGNWVFNYVTLKEPEKVSLLPFFLTNTNPPPGSISRLSFSVIMDRLKGQTFEVIVNLDKRQVESWTEVARNLQAPLTPEEMIDAEEVAREDFEVQRRSRGLGWANMSLVNGDVWSMGYIGDRPEYQGKRLVQLYLYGKNFPEDNQYAHPFDFAPVVDINERRVIAIEELPSHENFDGSNKQGNIVPRATSNYDPEVRNPESYRSDLHPVNVSQSGGPSFTVTGNELYWQKFKMRVGFSGREGLVIHHLSYNDSGHVRPLFYRMSLSEMFIPYGDPRPPYHRKHVFDEGQYGIGFNTVELQPQMDCIGEVHFFDGVVNTENGGPRKIRRAVCLHEEDAGILWKHTDYRTGKSTVIRSQRLALMFSAVVGNYDYIYTWYFLQDGSIEFNVKLTGALSVHLLAKGSGPAGHGSIVFPQINAQYHQHFFSVRLDAEIDGNGNSVAVSDVVPMTEPTGSPQNPYGQGFTTRTIELKNAASGRSNISPETSRTWHMKNPNSLHPYTREPVGWKLVPWPTPPTNLKTDSPIHTTAAWLDYSTWVTPYEENQLFPGGFYLNNSGLPEWILRNRNERIVNRDIVIWHNFGITHIPHSENFPIMPVETCGVMLKPMNFFKENPALDVRPPTPRRKEEL